MATSGPKIADGVIGRSKQVPLDRFFDPSTPSMGEGRNGLTKRNRKEINDGQVATNLDASQLPDNDIMLKSA